MMRDASRTANLIVLLISVNLSLHCHVCGLKIGRKYYLKRWIRHDPQKGVEGWEEVIDMGWCEACLLAYAGEHAAVPPHLLVILARLEHAPA